MIEPIVIRPAPHAPQDAEGIRRVQQVALGDAPYDPDALLATMCRPGHCTHVATEGAEIIGFCDTFASPTADGPRLEVDLLGVLPWHRRRGIATELLTTALKHAHGQGIQACRAIVRVDNLASRRVFERAGLHSVGLHYLVMRSLSGGSPSLSAGAGRTCVVTDTGICSEFTDPRDSTTLRLLDDSGACLAEAECLHVHTLAYGGLWVERVSARDATQAMALADALVALGGRHGTDRVGYLIPADAAGEHHVAWLRAGYERIGTYVVFQRDGEVWNPRGRPVT